MFLLFILGGPSGPPHMQPCYLHVSISFISIRHVSPLSKRSNWQIPSHLFDATMHCLILPHVTVISWSSFWSKSLTIFDHCIYLLELECKTIIFSMHSFSQVFLRWILPNSQYFSVPHRFPQESWGMDRNPGESTGIDRNLHRNPPESTGMDWNGSEFAEID